MPVIEARVRKVLGEVRSIVQDWSAMRDKMLALADELATRRMPVNDAGRREAQEFLRWAADDHFTFFGYREYRIERKDGERMLEATEGGLGLLRGKSKSTTRNVKSLAAHYMPQSGSVDTLILTKTNARSSVHRPGNMDYIGVLEFDAKGNPVAEQRFIGLYTSSAYNRRPWEIPLVRERHEHVMRQSGLSPNSHSGKALRHILETLPREELFQSNEDELSRTSLGILGLQERVRSKLFLRRDRYGRFFSALVYIPRERFNTDVRLRIEALLKEALHGEYVDTNVQLGESPLAQLHLVVRPSAGEQVDVDTAELEARLAHSAAQLAGRSARNPDRTPWRIRRPEALRSAMARALPAGYIETVSPDIAASDVEQLAALQRAGRLASEPAPVAPPAQGEGRLRLNLYRQQQRPAALRRACR